MDFQLNLALQAAAASESMIQALHRRVAELEAERDMLAQEVAVLEAVLERAAVRVPGVVDLDKLNPVDRARTIERLAAAGFTLDMISGADLDDLDDLDEGC